MFERKTRGTLAGMRWLYVLAGVAAYLGFVLLVARSLSDKWHPDGGVRDDQNRPS